MKRLALVLAFALFIPTELFAANTHSIDLETGSSQYLSRADTGVLSELGDFAVDAVFRLESLPGNDTIWGIATKDSGVLLGEYNLWYGRIGAEARHIRCGVGSVGNEYVTYDVDLTVNTWYRVRCTRVVATGRMILFIGELDVANAIQGTSAGDDSTNIFTIGRANSPFGDGIQYFDGQIDEVRIWGTASPTISTAVCAVGNETDLIGAWHLDDDLLDAGPNTLTLTNNNVATFSTDVDAGIVCGGGGGGTTGPGAFVFWTSPTWVFFANTYFHPLVFIASGLIFLAFVIMFIRLYQAFRDWYTRHKERF